MYLPVSDEVMVWISLAMLVVGFLLVIAEVYRKSRIAKKLKARK